MNMEKKKVLIMFGGPSPEHEVSRKSASSVVKNIDRELFDVDIIGITKEGRWYLTDAEPHEIADGSWAERQDNVPAVISPDRSVHGYVTGEAGASDGKKVRIDCVFPVFHGECGEDGTIQGLLQLADIPFVGSDMTSSACCMDKTVTKMIADSTGIRQAKYYHTTRFEFEEHPEEIIREIEEKFDGKYPLFIKPASAGSSFGITKAKNREDLIEGLKTAVTYDYKVLVEEMIVGREFGIAVLGNEKIAVSPVGEVSFANEFCDYKAKYTKTLQKISVVTDATEEKLEEFRNASVTMYRALGCRGMARVDFFYEEGTGEVVFNELNTIPGFTDISMYPKMWQIVGLSYDKLITKLIELAME
jgi:D-alanine-D-alanine ligase